MYDLTDFELNEYIKEDLPYFDLTTFVQNCKNTKAHLKIYPREEVIVACSEEAKRVAELLHCEVLNYIPSGEKAKIDESILEIVGDYNKIQQAQRLIQILLEYSCKIATHTYNMNKKIKNINQKCELLATRKSFPFSKRFCIKSILCGGALPHRLGLSETILFFESHRLIYNNINDFYKEIYTIKSKVPEKKVVVESSSIQDIKNLMNYGADVIQIDKADIPLLEEVIEYKNRYLYTHVKILAAGGININNVEKIVKTGVDGIVTSSLFTVGMADLGSKIILR